MLGMSGTCYNHICPSHPYMLVIVNFHNELAHNKLIVSSISICTVLDFVCRFKNCLLIDLISQWGNNSNVIKKRLIIHVFLKVLLISSIYNDIIYMYLLYYFQYEIFHWNIPLKYHFQVNIFGTVSLVKRM